MERKGGGDQDGLDARGAYSPFVVVVLRLCTLLKIWHLPLLLSPAGMSSPLQTFWQPDRQWWLKLKPSASAAPAQNTLLSKLSFPSKVTMVTAEVVLDRVISQEQECMQWGKKTDSPMLTEITIHLTKKSHDKIVTIHNNKIKRDTTLKWTRTCFTPSEKKWQ